MPFDPPIPCVGLVGWSGSGKTTLLEALISTFRRRGVRVAVVKYTHHRHLQTDQPGKDTWRFEQAGAVHTTLWSPDRVVHTHRYARPPSPDLVLQDVHDVDVILIEGYKGGHYPKIEVVRAARVDSHPEDPVLIPDLEDRVACVTDLPDPPFEGPTFPFYQVDALADFILTRLAPLI